jgi:uncharacterized protein YndB with AHSA1/START domain
MRGLIAALAVSLALAGAANAEVKSAANGRLHLENRVLIAAPPAKVYEALGQVGSWWEPSHTYSGKAENMTMPLQPGACFCEALPGGGVKHGEVVLAWPGMMVRVLGAFGPMQEYGVEAALTFTLKPTADGGTEVIQTYHANGVPEALLPNARVFDQVIGGQLGRFKTYVETGKAG